MSLYCSCGDITYLLPYCYLWAYRLKHLPCQFLTLFLLLVFTAQHSYWADPFYNLGFLSPFHSLGKLGPFHHFLPLSFSWHLLNSLSFHGPITTSLPLGLLAFEPTSFTNSFFWASPADFYFLSIFYISYGPTTLILGAFSTRLLSLRPIIILVGLLTIIPIILVQWPLFYYSFFFYLFHIVGLLILL